MTLTRFERTVLAAFMRVHDRGIDPLAQTVCREMGLALTARNLARVIVAIGVLVERAQATLTPSAPDCAGDET